jgi:hypothetical protein
VTEGVVDVLGERAGGTSRMECRTGVLGDGVSGRRAREDSSAASQCAICNLTLISLSTLPLYKAIVGGLNPSAPTNNGFMTYTF